MSDQVTRQLLDQFRTAWGEFSHATDSEIEWQAKQTARDCAMELALWMMNQPTTDTPTELDPDHIRGISPDERENPDTPELPHSVRAIVKEIHRAAQQSRRAGSAFETTLLYIQGKEKEGRAIRTTDRVLMSTLYHIKAMLISTKPDTHKIARIEQITAMALNLPFQAVQS